MLRSAYCARRKSLRYLHRGQKVIATANVELVKLVARSTAEGRHVARSVRVLPRDPANVVCKDRPVVADLYKTLGLSILQSQIELVGAGVDHVRKDHRVFRDRRGHRPDRLQTVLRLLAYASGELQVFRQIDIETNVVPLTVGMKIGAAIGPRIVHHNLVQRPELRRGRCNERARRADGIALARYWGQAAKVETSGIHLRNDRLDPVPGKCQQRRTHPRIRCLVSVGDVVPEVVVTEVEFKDPLLAKIEFASARVQPEIVTLEVPPRDTVGVVTPATTQIQVADGEAALPRQSVVLPELVRALADVTSANVDSASRAGELPSLPDRPPDHRRREPA